MTDPSPEQLARNRKFLLRAFVLLAGITGTIFYCGILYWVWQIPNKQRDGFELIAPFLGTIYFFLTVVPCWYFGLRNYALGIAGVFAVIALSIAIFQSYLAYPWF